MYGATIGDTGIFDDKIRNVVRAIAIWSPFEHRIVYFSKSDRAHISFKRARIILTEKVLDFRIGAFYKSPHYDFCGSERPKFLED